MIKAQQYLDDIQQIEKKTEQVLRIFGTLWDKRLVSLEGYIHKRYGL